MDRGARDRRPDPMPEHRLLPGSTVYLLLMLASVAGAAVWWSRRFRADSRLAQVFAGAVIGAFLGAKSGYLLAEGWIHRGEPDFWLRVASGKTVLGALLGGYAGVEAVKALIGYRRPTGDGFAAVAPLGIALGRLGCLAHGCCLGVACEPGARIAPSDAAGVPRWPAPLVELAFNLAALAVLAALRRNRVLPGQHFHLYLIAYGGFRFFHEFLRETPRWAGSLSGYQALALGVLGLGLWGFRRRARSRLAESPEEGRDRPSA